MYPSPISLLSLIRHSNPSPHCSFSNPSLRPACVLLSIISTLCYQVLSRDPWVVTFDNFLSDAEAKALISNVDQWEQSTDTGDTNEFGE